MPIAVRLPQLGTTRPTRVSLWLADPGEMVVEGDRLVEVLVPGITIDVAAPASGRLVRIERGPDAVVTAGEVLGWIEAEIDDV